MSSRRTASSISRSICRATTTRRTCRTCRCGRATRGRVQHVRMRLPGMAGTIAQLRFEYTQDGSRNLPGCRRRADLRRLGRQSSDAQCAGNGRSGTCGEQLVAARRVLAQRAASASKRPSRIATGISHTVTQRRALVAGCCIVSRDVAPLHSRLSDIGGARNPLTPLT